MKASQIQMLTYRFENIRMHENQNFASFYSELSNIVNSYFNLGKSILDSKVVKKNIKIPSKKI